MKRRRIGIACYPTYGGSGVVASELGLALAAKGHEVHVLSYENPIRLAGYQRNLFYHEVSVQDYPLFKYPPYALALATKMAEVVDQRDLDLMHVHYAIPHSVSAFLAKEMIGSRLKVVVTLHGTDITIVGNDPSYRRVTRFALERSDGITAVSNYLREVTEETFAIQRPIDVIPNFVDLERFDVKPCPDASALRQDDERVLVHVSNFRPVKRVHDIIRATANLARRRPVRVLMIGDGPDRSSAERLSAELGLTDRIHFLGSQDAVEKIIPCADLFLLPSRYESFGLAALEAMACGVPVVASRAGGIPEVVDDGVTGRLHAMGDVDDLTRVADELLDDPEALQRMGTAARVRAEREFAMSHILPHYEAFYERVLAGDATTS